MELLFKREQTSAKHLKVAFKLWGKIEVDDEEQEIIKRYNFADAFFIEITQPGLKRNAAIFGGIIWFAVYAIFTTFLSTNPAVIVGLVFGAGAGYWWFHQKRESIYVKDLLHGRHFKCRSVIDLAHKEAWLENQVLIFRQVMESAKHWDGTQAVAIEALPKGEIKPFILANT